MKKLTALLVALILVCSLLPMSVFAETETIMKNENTTQDASTKKEVNKNKEPTVEDTKAEASDKNESTEKNHKKKHRHPKPAAHDHAYNGYGSNTEYHWLQCACGCRINVEPHVDPLETDDDYCVCGYHFSDDADLVTLWLDGCEGLKNFRKDVYEYKTKAYTYKEVNEIKRIATRTHDSEATVELPADLTLKEGENKIEIKVTSENKKVTKTYTVIVHKEA